MKFVGKIVLLMMLLFFTANIVEAKEEVIEVTGEYILPAEMEDESFKLCEERAREEAKRKAVESAGVFVQSETKTQGFKLESDEISLLAARFMRIEEQKRTREPLENGDIRFTVTIKAFIDVDSEKYRQVFEDRIAYERELERHKALLEAYEKEKQKNERLKRELKELQDKMESDEEIRKRWLKKRVESDNGFQSFLAFQEGNKLFDKGNYEEALKVYEKSISLNPEFLASYMGLICTYFNVNEKSKIKNIIDLAIKNINDKNFNFYSIIGCGYEFVQEYDKAEENYKKVIQLAPNKSSGYSSLGILYCFSLEEYDKAEECLKKAIQLAPNDSNRYSDLGTLYEIIEHYDKAEECYKKVIQLAPNNFYGYVRLGNLYEKLKGYDEAEEVYKQEIAASPNDFSGYSALGDLYKELKRYDEAFKYYNKAIELNPTAEWLKDNKNNLLKKIEYDSKIKKYEAMLNNDITSYKNISNELWKTYTDAKDYYDSAVEVYKKVIQKYPNDSNAYFKLGYSYHILNDYDNAIIAYKKSAELNPYEGAYVNIGSCYENKQQYDEALKYYNKALELNPKYDLALKGRERVLSKMKEQK